MKVINFTHKILFYYFFFFFTSVFTFTSNNSMHDIALMKIFYTILKNRSSFFYKYITEEFCMEQFKDLIIKLYEKYF